MLRVYANKYIALGRQIEQMAMTFYMAETSGSTTEERSLRPDEITALKSLLTDMEGHCRDLGLSVSASLVKTATADPPQTEREFRLLERAIKAELAERLFLYIPHSRSVFYENSLIISVVAQHGLPSTREDIRDAGTAYAVGLYTSSVYHCMRALERCLHALARHLGVSFTIPIELENWQTIIDRIESDIRKKQTLPKGTAKDIELGFLSAAAIQFRYFKDAWRNYTMHGRAQYNEAESLQILEHARQFIEELAAHGVKETTS